MIRIADTQYSVLTLLLGSMQPILIVLTIGLGLSFYLAWKLSKRIVKPLNEMDLDHPDEKLVYEELAPLVKRLNLQQRQISIQRSDLQRKRDEFEAATSHMSEGIILLDETGSILSINASARRILKATLYCVGKDILLFNNTYEFPHFMFLTSASMMCALRLSECYHRRGKKASSDLAVLQRYLFRITPLPSRSIWRWPRGMIPG